MNRHVSYVWVALTILQSQRIKHLAILIFSVFGRLVHCNYTPSDIIDIIKGVCIVSKLNSASLKWFGSLDPFELKLTTRSFNLDIRPKRQRLHQSFSYSRCLLEKIKRQKIYVEMFKFCMLTRLYLSAKICTEARPSQLRKGRSKTSHFSS